MAQTLKPAVYANISNTRIYEPLFTSWGALRFNEMAAFRELLIAKVSQDTHRLEAWATLH